MAIDSSLYRMADRLCEGSLASIIAEMKGQGDSFAQIAKRLYAEHGVDVTGQTVANWLADPDSTEPDEVAS